AHDERSRANTGVCMSRGQLRRAAHPERRSGERGQVVQAFSPGGTRTLGERRPKGLHYIVVLLLATVPLSAQWLGVPTPGVPRTADGKPDLAAPAPKTPDGHPDISGVWMPNTRTLQDLAVGMTPPGEVPYQPWAAQLVKDRAN